MTRLMNNIYDFRLQDILKTTSSTRQFAENSMMQLRYCVLALVFLYAGAYNAAHADTYEDYKWDGTYGTPGGSASSIRQYFSGTGTEADPYIIDSAYKFATFGYLCSYVFTGVNHYGYFLLTTDIDLNNIEWFFGESKGRQLEATFDGGGHTISNLKLIASASNDAGDGSQYSGNRQYGLFVGARGTTIHL